MVGEGAGAGRQAEGGHAAQEKMPVQSCADVSAGEQAASERAVQV